MSALVWIASNWKLIALMALVGFLMSMGIRIQYLNNRLAASRQREKQLEGYKDGREAYDEIDADLGRDASASREFLRQRKRSTPRSVLRRNIGGS